MNPAPAMAGPSTEDRVQPKAEAAALQPLQAAACVLGAVASFHLAHGGLPGLEALTAVYLLCLWTLSALPTGRQCFYLGLLVGYGVYAPHLAFFASLFGWPAIALWTVLAFWLGLFVALARLCRRSFDPACLVLVPCLWTGIEFFRSELYYLRFSWLGAGYAFSGAEGVFSQTSLGVYGTGFVIMLLMVVCSRLRRRHAIPAVMAVLLGLTALGHWPRQDGREPVSANARMAGLQLEFPTEEELFNGLNVLVKRHPDAELIVLSEYTLDAPPSERLLDWCRAHRRHLIVGGREPAPEAAFYNTAFVLDPAGRVVHRQAKAVPVQFFADGLPAAEQSLWNSPWGPVGIGICYDLSYRRVMDRLVRLGARALIIPTSDSIEWGGYEHWLHARIAPVRAAEYGLPIFRVAGSGISQSVGADGRVRASAGFPGQGEVIADVVELRGPGRLPMDTWLAPASVMVTIGLIGAFVFQHIRRRKT